MHTFYKITSFCLMFFFLKNVECRPILQSYEPVQNQTILIQLHQEIKFNELSIFHIYNISNSVPYTIIVQNLSSQAGVFGVLQIHSHLYPVTLTDKQSRIVSGTNIGFVIETDENFTLTTLSSFGFTEMAVALIFYDQSVAPVPGGCGKSPVLDVSLVNDDEVIEVEASLALSSNSKLSDCLKANLSYETLYRYLRVGDMSSRTYFNGIKDMITVKGAQKKGLINLLKGNKNSLTGFYAKLRGTAIVFQTIAVASNGVSAYIPAVSYSCQPFLWDNDCNKHYFLEVTFYVMCLLIGVALMTSMLLPRAVTYFTVGLLTGTVVGTFVVIYLNAGTEWKFFVTTFIALICAKINVCVVHSCCRYLTHYLLSFWISYATLISIFYIGNTSFNLEIYQCYLLIALIIVATVSLSSRNIRSTRLSISLGVLLFIFSVSYLANGSFNAIVEHPYYLFKHHMYRTAVKRVIIAPQDLICVCLGSVLLACNHLLYHRFGEIWEDMVDSEKLSRATHVSQFGGTFAEKLEVSSEFTPLIIRFTDSEEDDVFESPERNKEYLKIMKSRN